MELSEFTGLIAGSLVITLGLWVMSFGKNVGIANKFAFFCLLLGAWNFGDLGKILVANYPRGALVVERASFGFAAFLPWAYFIYAKEIVKNLDNGGFWTKIIFIVSFMFFLLSPTNFLVYSVEFADNKGILVGGAALGSFYLTLLVVDVFILTLFFKDRSTIAKVNFISQIVLLVGIIINYFYLSNIVFVKLEYLFEIIFILMSGIAILKHNMLDLRVILTETATWLILSFVIIFSFVIQYNLFGSSSLLIIVLFGLQTVLWSIYGKEIKKYLVTTAQKTFIKGWYNYEEKSKKISKSLGNARSIEHALFKILEFLDDDIEITRPAIRVRDGFFANQTFFGNFTSCDLTDGKLRSDVSVDVGNESDWIDARLEAERTLIKIRERGWRKAGVPKHFKDYDYIMPIRTNNHGLCAYFLIGKKYGEIKLSNSDLNLLSSIQSQLSTLFHFHIIAIEAGQVRSAKELQHKLKPQVTRIPGYDVAVYADSSSAVGGDYMDMYALPNTNQHRMILGDIVHHGLEAGIGTFILATVLEMAIMDGSIPTLIDLNALVNQVFTHFDIKKELNITLTMATLDLSPDGAVTYCGYHDPFVIYRHAEKHIDAIKVDTFPGRYGAFDIKASAISTAQTQLNDGDIMVIYTDGLTEAKHHADLDKKNMFGTGNIGEVLLLSANDHADQIKDNLIKRLKQWAGDIVEDDISIIIVKKI